MPGVDWQEELARQINELAAVVVLWTPLSVSSKNVKDEARLGQREEKLVNALCGVSAPPFPFDRTNGLPLDGWSGRESHGGWSRLVRTIEDHLVQVAGATHGELTAALERAERAIWSKRMEIGAAEEAYLAAKADEEASAAAVAVASEAVDAAQDQLRRVVDMRGSPSLMRAAQTDLNAAFDERDQAEQARKKASAALAAAARSVARAKTELDREFDAEPVLPRLPPAAARSVRADAPAPQKPATPAPASVEAPAAPPFAAIALEPLIEEVAARISVRREAAAPPPALEPSEAVAAKAPARNEDAVPAAPPEPPLDQTAAKAPERRQDPAPPAASEPPIKPVAAKARGAARTPAAPSASALDTTAKAPDRPGAPAPPAMPAPALDEAPPRAPGRREAASAPAASDPPANAPATNAPAAKALNGRPDAAPAPAPEPAPAAAHATTKADADVPLWAGIRTSPLPPKRRPIALPDISALYGWRATAVGAGVAAVTVVLLLMAHPHAPSAAAAVSPANASDPSGQADADAADPHIGALAGNWSGNGATCASSPLKIVLAGDKQINVTLLGSTLSGVIDGVQANGSVKTKWRDGVWTYAVSGETLTMTPPTGPAMTYSRCNA